MVQILSPEKISRENPNGNGSSISRSSENVGDAFDGSLGIENVNGAWIHSNPTGCTYIYCQTPGTTSPTVSSDKIAVDLFSLYFTMKCGNY